MLQNEPIPRVRQVYGKEDIFDAERVVDLLEALETFTAASSSAQGDLVRAPQPVSQPPYQQPRRAAPHIESHMAQPG